jgi:YidC/Oxa1 family membrane protein insertase
MFQTFIVNPLITILAVFYSLLGNNIVLAIIALTVIIRLATSPLLIRQQQATAKMTEMQPKLKKLQEKYKNDREKLAQEQMQLYKEAGVNPLGGCLPIFIQLPIMIALYQAIIMGLASTPFQVVDLSGRFLLSSLGDLVPLQNQWAGMDLTLAPTMNPVYALAFPLVVGITTWLQSKLTMPAPQPTGDAKADQSVQITQSMTTIMPIMFAFFSLSFSVGLSIYFVVSNVVGIVQYTMMGKADWKGLFGGKKPEANKALVSDTAPSKSATPAKATSSGGSQHDEVVTATPRPRANRNDKKMRSKQ